MTQAKAGLLQKSKRNVSHYILAIKSAISLSDIFSRSDLS